MKITITLTDVESGQVKIEATPAIEKIKQIATSERDKISPALAYAMNALAVLMKASLAQSQKEGRISIPEGIIRPKFVSPRR